MLTVARGLRTTPMLKCRLLITHGICLFIQITIMYGSFRFFFSPWAYIFGSSIQAAILQALAEFVWPYERAISLSASDLKTFPGASGRRRPSTDLLHVILGWISSARLVKILRVYPQAGRIWPGAPSPYRWDIVTQRDDPLSFHFRTLVKLPAIQYSLIIADHHVLALVSVFRKWETNIFQYNAL